MIDSNFILLPFQFKIDYFNEIRAKLEGQIRFILFEQIFNELESKMKRKPNATKFTRFYESGLSYLEQKKEDYDILIIKNVKNDNETTDDFLLRKLKDLRKENQRVFIATNDSELRKKAKNLSISTIFLRQKKYLSIDKA